MKTLAIIGGGAAGMVAAIEACHTNPSINIVIYERMDRVGKKLLATGNGRCNYTNMGATVANYHGQQPQFVKPALEKYTVGDTINFFNSLGVFPREEEKGKLYPYSGQASAVLDALRYELSRLNIKIIQADISAVVPTSGGFTLKDKAGNRYSCHRLIMAAGGCASPALGSDGSGFSLLKGLGHTISPLYPALVQLKTDTRETKALKGIKIEGTITLMSKEKVIATDSGEILFTDYGLSGPPVFQLSAATALQGSQGLTASIDFMGEYPQHNIYDILAHRKNSLNHLTMEAYFTGLLNKRLGNIIARRIGIEKLSYPVKSLTKEQLWAITALIKDFRLQVLGTKGFSGAQVTAGGALTERFNPHTMESLLVKGLYCAGEILDIYGDCGGYNLQWAWSSGRLAGSSAAKEM